MKPTMQEPKLPTAAEIMNRAPLTFTPDVEITQAIATLLKHGYSGAPVVDGAGMLLGVLSEKDCIRVLSTSAFHGAPNGNVGDHMTPSPVAVTPSADIFQLVFAFHDGTFRRVLVADGGKLVGLITRRDVLRALDELRRAREKLPRTTTYDAIAAQHERDLND